MIRTLDSSGISAKSATPGGEALGCHLSVAVLKVLQQDRFVIVMRRKVGKVKYCCLL